MTLPPPSRALTRTASELAPIPRATRPNIVFVLADDLSWNLVRFMPHVLQMQRDGVTFKRFFVTDSLCCPSRASILTGRLPHNTGVFTNTPPDGGFEAFQAHQDGRSTFATALQSQGYLTAIMGKYLNGYLPGTRHVPPGWNEWDLAGDAYREFDYRLDQNGRAVDYGHRSADYLTDVIARRGSEFIDAAASGGRPFMLELATFAPHYPYTPAPRDALDFAHLRAPRARAFDVANLNPPKWLGERPPLSRANIAYINRGFRARAQAVQAIDDLIGRVQATLRARGLARNTYIVFNSDNSYHMGEHRLAPGKLTAFDSDIRVPLIVTGPGVPVGGSVHGLTGNIDLRSTFSGLGGAPVPANVDGHSLVGFLHGRPVTGWRRAVLIEHHGHDTRPLDPDNPPKDSGDPTSYEAMRTLRALYVEYADGEYEYYDLVHDPAEVDNIFDQLSPVRRLHLHDALTRLVQCHGRRGCWAAARMNQR